MRPLFALLLLLAIDGHTQSVLIPVEGYVLDAAFQDPLPLATVQVDSLQLGSLTSMEGAFSLALPPGRWQLRVQMIGYQDTSYWVTVPSAGSADPVVIYVAPRKSLSLEDVGVGGKESPANRIIRNASKMRAENRLENIPVWEREAYSKTTLTLHNITDKQVQKSLLLRPARSFLQDAWDSLPPDSNVRHQVGVFVTETVSRQYHRAGHLPREQVLGTRGSGFESAETGLIAALLANVDFYENYVTILERQFISPLAPGALANYRFFWLDTLVAPGKDTLFGIKVVPRRVVDPVFKGWIYIEGGSWAIRRLDLSLNKNTNINFIENIYIRQEFDTLDGKWVPILKDVRAQFNHSEKRPGFVGRNMNLYRSYVLDKAQDDAFYTGETLQLREGATQQDSLFWQENRQSPLEGSDSLAFALMGHLQERFFWQAIRFTQEFLETGKKRVGVFDFGPYSKMAGFNEVEGLRLQLGMYSNPRFSMRTSFGIRAAYGLTDERWKYGGEFQYRFSRLPDIRAGISYYDDIEQVGIANYELEGAGILPSALMFRPLTQLNYYRDANIWFQADLFPGLNMRVQGRNKYFLPAFPFYFGGGTSAQDVRSAYTISELSTTFRISFKENYIIKKTEKVYTGSPYPILYLELGAGLNNVLSSDIAYQRLKLTLTDKLRLGRMGWLTWTASAGQFFGEIPFPSLYVFQGSQSLGMFVMGGQLDALRSFMGKTNRTSAYQSVTFNLMHLYEFVADQFVVAGGDWHLEGWFFKKLPGLNRVLNKLKWKEVVSLRMASGSLTTANLQLNNPVLTEAHTPGIEVKAPLDLPYVEYGVGVENIFRLLRIDYVRRLTYLNPQVPEDLEGVNFNWGLRFSVNISF